MNVHRHWSKYVKPWWVQLTLPVLLAVAIFLGVSYILFAGTKRDQLSSAVEVSLIAFAIDLAVEEVDDPGVLVVSAKRSDLSELEKSDFGFLSDLSLEVYVDLARAALEGGSERVYLSWIPSSQPVSSRYFSSLIALSETYRDRLFVGYPVEELPYVDPFIRENINFLEADDCGWDVQVVCTYNKQWSDWIIQHLVNAFSPAEFSSVERHFISKNLPHFRSNYIMNLPLKSGIRQLSARDVMGATLQVDFRGKLVFIGPDLQFPELQTSNKVLVRRTFTAEDNADSSVALGGTAMHVMWAQVVSMLRTRRYVAVAPRALSAGLAVLFCLAIVTLLIRRGAVFALASFLIIALVLPFANAFGLAFFRVYLPVFTIIYSGLVVFLFSALGQLSYQTYRQWRYDQLARAHSETTQLRRNFLAIVSHNLNTPIAQIQGLVDILASSGREQPPVRELASRVAMMQMFVRSVLIQSSLESGGLQQSSLSPRRFVESFDSAHTKTLATLGLETSVALKDPEDDYNDMPVLVDERVMSHVVSNLLLVAHSSARASRFSVSLAYDDERARLVLSFSSEECELAHVFAALARGEPLAAGGSARIFCEMIVKFVELTGAQLDAHTLQLRVPV